MKITSLKVGDKITISGREIRTVAVVHKNSITDSKGQKWTSYGEMWGSSGGYGSPHASAWMEGDDEVVAKERQKRRESSMRNEAESAIRTVSFAALEKIIAIIKEDQAGAQP